MALGFFITLGCIYYCAKSYNYSEILIDSVVLIYYKASINLKYQRTKLYIPSIHVFGLISILSHYLNINRQQLHSNLYFLRAAVDIYIYIL